MEKTILMVHGRHWKPVKDQLLDLWVDAMRFGISRDRPEKLAAFDAAKKMMVYYGDLSNEFLARKTGKPVPNRVSDRRLSLERLKRYRAEEFGELAYEMLPGQSKWNDALARSVGSLAKLLRLGRPAIELYAPDIREYWNQDSEFGTELRARMLDALTSLLHDDETLCVISHSLGAIICYDIFWKLSRTGEYMHRFGSRKIDFWITLGAPLADSAIRKNLKGFHAFGPRRYPSNVRQWLNIWAVDDYLCHEEELSADFHDMVEYGLTEEIADRKIYNLSVRNGKSNPHCSVGYLIHPETARAVADWL
ncbi:MAG: hypothetical protein AB1921_20115 [Thermodesulfobacteriota bacterium]